MRPGTMRRSPRPSPSTAPAPVLMSLVSLQSGGTAGNGKMEAGDKLVLTYSEAVTGLTFNPAVTESRPNNDNDVTLNIVGFTTTADTGSSGYVSSKSKNLTSTGAAALSAGNTTVTITLGAIGGTGTAATSNGALVFNQTGTTIKDAAGNAATRDLHHPVRPSRSSRREAGRRTSQRDARSRAATF